MLDMLNMLNAYSRLYNRNIFIFQFNPYKVKAFSLSRNQRRATACERVEDCSAGWCDQPYKPRHKVGRFDGWVMISVYNTFLFNVLYIATAGVSAFSTSQAFTVFRTTPFYPSTARDISTSFFL